MRLVVAVLTATLLITASASAARPPLDLERANRVAQHEAAYEQASWNEDETLWRLDWPDMPDEPFIVGYELDPCERTGPGRAECDLTYALDDGDLCDDTFEVRTTRRNRVRVDAWGWICDSDAPDL